MIVCVADPMDAHNSQTVCVAGPMDAHDSETAASTWAEGNHCPPPHLEV
jgi:hypothetical protein